MKSTASHFEFATIISRAATAGARSALARASVQAAGNTATARATAGHATAGASFAVSPEILSQPINGAESESYNLQWMPPGAQDIVCFVDGEPTRLSFTVTARHAEMFNEQLQALLAKAQAGTGDRPFTDYNHEDGPASSRPVRMVWGGSDPKNGGIRLIGKWTATAKQSIRDDEFDRFSPQWKFDKNTSEPLSIGVNLGGLVNKAAFQSIAKAQAGDASAAVSEPPGHVFNLITKRAAEKGISIREAAKEIALEYPGLADAIYKASRAHGPMEFDPCPAQAAYAMRGSKKVLPLENHPFVAKAKAIAAEQLISEGEAQLILARKDFMGYQSYCASFAQGGGSRAGAQAKRCGQTGLLQAVKEAQARGMSFDEAVTAASTAHPDLVEAYRLSFLKK